MNGEWVGEPDVEETWSRLRIEQRLQAGSVESWDEVVVTVFDDGEVRFAGRNERPASVPAHWMPIVTEFLVRAGTVTGVAS